MSREAMILEMVRALVNNEDLDTTDEDQARDFLARGMLINASLAMRMVESPEAAERDYLATVLGAAAPGPTG